MTIALSLAAAGAALLALALGAWDIALIFVMLSGAIAMGHDGA